MKKKRAQFLDFTDIYPSKMVKKHKTQEIKIEPKKFPQHSILWYPDEFKK